MHIIELLIIGLHAGKHSEILIELLLALDIRELFRNRAIGDGEIEALKEIWKNYKENLTRQHLISVILPDYGNDYYGITLLHSAAQTNNPEVLALVWEWVKKELRLEELKHKFYLTENCKASSTWHVAAQYGNPKTLEKLWEWAKENLTPEELKYGLLLAKTEYGKTAFHEAAKIGQHRY
jgi:endo-1,4-beta-D-glucanase Y